MTQYEYVTVEQKDYIESITPDDWYIENPKEGEE